MQLTEEQITGIIQTIKKGIDASDIGPLFIWKDATNPGSDGTKVFSPVAFEIFKIFLNKMEQIEIVPSAPPSELLLDDDHELL